MKQGIPGFRRLGVAALAALTVSVGLIPFAGSASATASFTSTRLAGNNRYDTAKVIATNTFSSAPTVLVARGDLYPDALAGNYLAGNKSAPILLTFTDKLADETKTALTSLGATSAIILGGTQAVADSVADELRARGLTVTRIGGNTRFATAAQIAQSPGAGNVGTVDGKKSAIVASGENFPDALAGGPASYKGALPTLLTTKAALSPETSAALDALAIKQVFLLGGIAAVEEQVATAMTAKGITVTRLAGADRSETATKISTDLNFLKLAFTKAHINLARGDDFADALTGGPHGGKNAESIVLAQSPTTLGTATSAYVCGLSSTLTSGHVFGGTVAITDATKAAFDTCAQSGFITVARGSTGPVAAGNPITGTITPASGVTITSISISGPCITTQTVTPAAGGGATSFSVNTNSTAAAGTCTISVTTGFTGPNGAGSETDTFDVTIVAAPAGGGGGGGGITPTITPTVSPNESYLVTPTASATQNTGTNRGFTATGLGTDSPIRIQLFNCNNVTGNPGAAVKFERSSTTTTPTAVPGDTGGASIGSVNGVTQPAGSTNVAAVAVNGSIQFFVNGPSGSSAGICVEPVVYQDSNSNAGLDLKNDSSGLATEKFGVGGSTTFAPGAATTGTTTGTVTSVDKANNSFTMTDANTGALTVKTFKYDANDRFNLCTTTPTVGSNAGCGQPISLATFAAALSRGDTVGANYNADPAVTSEFNLFDTAPFQPGTTSGGVVDRPTTATVSGATIIVGFGDSGTPSVSAYRIYRAISSTASGNVCPTFPSQSANNGSTNSGTAGSFTRIAEVADRTGTTADGGSYQYVDSAITTGTSYCYNVTSVGDGDESDNTGTTAPVVAGTTAPAPTPPAAAARITDLRAITDTSVAGFIDAGDVHRFIFDKAIVTPTAGSSYTVQGANTVTVSITCSANVNCYVNGITQTITAGTAAGTYGPGRILYSTVFLQQTVSGTGLALYPGTLLAVSSGFTDVNGNQVDVANSPDKTLELNPCVSSSVTATVSSC